MTDPEPTDESQAPAPSESAWERKRRLAEIFGDVLPSTTRDERDPGESRPAARNASEAWLLSQVPPHHGGHG